MINSIRQTFFWYVSYMKLALATMTCSAVFLFLYAGAKTGSIPFWVVALSCISLALLVGSLCAYYLQRKKLMAERKRLEAIEASILELMVELTILNHARESHLPEIKRCEEFVVLNYLGLRNLVKLKITSAAYVGYYAKMLDRLAILSRLVDLPEDEEKIDNRERMRA